MEAKIDDIQRDIDEIKSQLREVMPQLRDLKAFIVDMKRELGVRRGEEMYQQMDKLIQREDQREDKINQILRDTEHTKKLVEYNEVNVKEIMKALAYIYRNVDELESNLVPDKKT